MSGIHAAVQAVTSRQREYAQGQPRQSRIRFFVIVSGDGETRLAGTNALSFNTYMLEEPTFTYGVTATNTIADGALPLCTAIVTSYIRNDKGLYTGANLAFNVESADPEVRLKFSLTFEGSAVRTTADVDSI